MTVVSRNSDRRFDGKVSFSDGDEGSLMEVREKKEKKWGRRKGRLGIRWGNWRSNLVK